MREEIAIFLLEALSMPPGDAAMKAAFLINPSCTQEELVALRPLAQVWWGSVTRWVRAAEYLIQIDPNPTYGTWYTRGVCACIEWALERDGVSDGMLKGALEHLRGRGPWTLSMEYRRKHPSSFTYGGKYDLTLWHRISKLYEIVQNCGPAEKSYTFDTLAECSMARSSMLDEEYRSLRPLTDLQHLMGASQQIVTALRTEFPRIPMPLCFKEYTDAVSNGG